MQTPSESTRWFRQFWPWFVFGLPGLVVIASLITVYIAVSHPDPLVDGNYYKHGLTINEKLNADTIPDKTPDTTPSSATVQPTSKTP